MPLQSFYPVLLADDVEESARFFKEHLGFAPTFEGDWYVSLRHRENPVYELAIISYDHETIPEGARRPTSALLLNFEVPSAEDEYGRLQALGIEILQPLEDLPTGQRHFICRAPGGLMVDIIQEILPDAEFAGQYID
ncbi:MAG: VOC family protein [Rubrobacteraceae bacterium]